MRQLKEILPNHGIITGIMNGIACKINQEILTQTKNKLINEFNLTIEENTIFDQTIEIDQ